MADAGRPAASLEWEGPTPKEEECPAIRFSDGAVLHQPTAREVARAVGLQIAPHATEYDAMVIGGGPAGLAAAVYGASEGLRTIVVEREAPGGQAGTSSRIENYLGFPNGVSGDELASRALQQARRLGAEIVVTRSVDEIDTEAMEVVLDGEERIRTHTMILATGVAWRRVAIEGADRLIGKGVYYGAARSEAGATYGLDVYLIGAGNSAGQAALYFANHARSVTLAVRGDALEKSMSRYLIDQLGRQSNVGILLNSEVAAVYGEANLAAIDLRDCVSGDVRRMACGGLFIFIGADAQTDWLPAPIARDARGYVLTGADIVKAGRWKLGRDPFLLETSAPGIFACGDVRLSPVKRVASAVGEGSMAIAYIHHYLHAAAPSGLKSGCQERGSWLLRSPKGSAWRVTPTNGRAVKQSRSHPARYGDQRAGHGAGLVGRQEQHDRGELSRPHPMVERGVRHVAAVGRRVDDRRQHRVDRHAFQLQFLGQAFGQPMNGGFAGGIGAHARRGPERRLRADVDDAAGAAFQEIGERGLAGVQRSLQVQRVQTLPGLGAAALHFFPLKAAGDVEERVEPPKSLLDRGHRLLRALGRREVHAAHEQRVRSKTLGERGGRGRANVEHGDRSAALDRRRRHAAAESAEPASHHDRLAAHDLLPSKASPVRASTRLTSLRPA